MRFALEILVAVALWVILTLGRHALHAAAHRFSAAARMTPFFRAFSCIAWLAFVLWVVRSRFSGEPLYPVLMLCLALLLAGLLVWFVLRDVVAGIVFSSRSQFLPDHSIRLGELSGKVIRTGITHLVVRTEKGDVARIPYSRLSSEVVSERAEDAASDFYRVRLAVRKPADPDQIRAALVRTLLCNPWALFRTAPIVRLKGEDAAYDFEVLFQSLNSRHATRVERHLKTMMGSDRDQSRIS